MAIFFSFLAQEMNYLGIKITLEAITPLSVWLLDKANKPRLWQGSNLFAVFATLNSRGKTA